MAWLAGGILLLAGFCIMSAERGYTAANRMLHPPRRPITADERKELPDARDVQFRTADGLSIHGWYLPSRNGAAVVMVHGLTENRARFIPDAQLLSEHGFGVLAIDLRAHGESEGSVATWGDRERQDLEAALSYLLAQPGVDRRRVGAIGFSVGGLTVAGVAARDPRLAAIILEGTNSSMDKELVDDFGKWGPLSLLPARWAFQRAGVHVEEVNAERLVRTMPPRPLLVIDGGQDKRVTRAQENPIFLAAPEPKEYWLVPSAGHGEYFQTAPEEYRKRVLAFFQHALAKRGASTAGKGT